VRAQIRKFAARFSHFSSLTPLPSLFSLLFSLLSILTCRPAAAMVLRRTWVERRGQTFIFHLRLSGNPRWILTGQSSRLQIELLDTRSDLEPGQFLRASAGPLGTVRIVGEVQERVRMQIDTAGQCNYVVGRVNNELIVGLAPRGADSDLAAAFAATRSSAPRRIAVARRPLPAATVSPDYSTPQRVARADHDSSAPAIADVEPRVQGHPIVVVDPGHGGQDPGTRSDDGLLEKDLALQIANRLAEGLTRRGIQPVMTRNSDIYLTLAQRTAIANRAGAELFVAVHLNWSPNPQTSGIEVYYLNNTTDRATIRLAKMENAAQDGSAPLDPSLNYILSDLQQQYKATESTVLAQMMEEQAVGALQSDFGGEIRGLGAKRGPFYVLVGPRIPAVLVECGFLSNSEEARRLASPQYQQVLADSLAASVVRYLNQDVTAGTL
jgi:N-acetylmuramoyl-L-alanine amidase